MNDTPWTQHFGPATQDWFRAAFAGPTAVQSAAWEAIASGDHTLVIAPTGSGKTLAAFLTEIDQLSETSHPTASSDSAAQGSEVADATDRLKRCRVVYVSPLKALAADVQRNLRAPLTGIRQSAQRLGLPVPDIQVGMRTGDTPAEQRRAFARTPPDVLVTTPESLFLLLTSQARNALSGVRTVIVDEIHAVAGTKRGAHLALSLERLDAMLERPAQRVGLSATVRPVSEMETFLASGQRVRTVQPANPKQVEVTVEVPLEDLANLGSASAQQSAEQESGSSVSSPSTSDALARELEQLGEQPATTQPSIWPAIQRQLLDLIRQHRSTIVFTNSRRLAERITAGVNELASEAPPPADGHFPAQAVGQSGITTGSTVELAKAHHGSMSKQQRGQVEEELKSGQLAAVIATSSLELGIDMGAVDLVVQVESPPSVASGLQRIGRGGHHVGAVSRGVLIPKFRGDLLGCALTAERMSAGLIESLRFPRNPLDVLAQQIVAMVAVEPWSLSELATVVRRAAPFAGLPDSALQSVLEMLSGRYPSEEFGELRARIVWDRTTDELSSRPGAQRLAVTSGGTIPDRGLFTVVTPGEPGQRGRVGELDEEMVYESRVGDTFLLGTSAWTVQEITYDRVVVVPAPGQPARMPFWKGDAPARPYELGQALGAFTRELTASEQRDAEERLGQAGMSSWASSNLLSFLDEQRQATGHVPDDQTIVAERFRDELGDWRLVVHSPFGAAVNGPWSLLIAARLREQRGIDPQVAASDDGIVLRLADALDESGAEVVPHTEDVVLDPEGIREAVTSEITGSALFAARFRECAARALLLPRRDPARRSPLWQQRHRSAQLLSVAARYEEFPIVLEAMRECLQDVYDIEHLAELMSAIAARQVRVVEVETPTASPFAKSLLLGYVGMFLYDTDAPLAERRTAALSLDSSLLAELLGSEAIRELLDPDVVVELEAQLQRLEPERHVRHAEDTVDLLRFLGDLTTAELQERGADPDWLAELERARRIIRVRIAGEERWVSIEDSGRLRDGLGVALPVGIPEAFTEPSPDPLRQLLIRYARSRGPFRPEAAAARFGLPAGLVNEALNQLASTGQLVRGELRPLEAGGGQGEEFCDADVLRRLRSRSLAKLRATVEPVEPSTLGRFLPAWHGIGRRTRRASTVDDVMSVIEQLAGIPLPASSLESLILPARLPDYSPALLDELTSTGEVSWVGCGGLAGGDGWIALAPTELAELLLPDNPGTADSGTTAKRSQSTVEQSIQDSGNSSGAHRSPLHSALHGALEGGALFFRQLADRAGAALVERGESTPDDDAVIEALWDLVWDGLVTNDTLAPLRARLSGRAARHRTPHRPRGRYARLRPARPHMPSRTGPPSVSGRWSLAPRPEADPTQRAQARAEAFLERHGVVTRGSIDTERVTGGFAGVYRVLRAMEEAGRCRRGYVIAGLGPAQFALPGAIDRLRNHSTGPTQQSAVSQHETSSTIVLAATDPAQPYGAALGWPEAPGSHRPGRKAGGMVVLVDGEAVAYVERGGKSVLTFTNSEDALRSASDALAGMVRAGRLEQLVIQRVNGASSLDSALGSYLAEAGFRTTPQGLRLRA